MKFNIRRQRGCVDQNSPSILECIPRSGKISAKLITAVHVSWVGLDIYSVQTAVDTVEG